MSLGALAGFGLVFVVTAWTVSVLGGLAIASARGWLRRLGPMTEQRAAEVAAVLPLVLAVLTVAILIAHSTLGTDHCAAHDHHAHLCVVHGAPWIERTWVVVALAVAAATMLGRMVIVVGSYVRGARGIRDLQRLSRQAGQVRLVESDRAFCFVARAGIYVSSRAWSALPDGERAALVAHEAAHVDHGDLRKRAMMEALLVFAAPFVGDRVRTAWLHASERRCDARAAAVIGAPETVASAMISMCRLQTARPAPSFGFTPTADELAGRVQAVLAGSPVGERTAVVLTRSVVVFCLVLAILGLAAAEPIHHAFETLLG
jgi:Zn-dependent protease with chaperone function